MPTPTFSAVELHEVAVHATRETVRKAMEDLESGIQDKFATTVRTMRGGHKKKGIYEDFDLERHFREMVHTFQKPAGKPYSEFAKIFVAGEETLDDLKRELRDDPDATFACVDPLDGSDLYQRKFGNWCCASSFFVKRGDRGQLIKAVAVGVPDGPGMKVFSAIQGETGIRVIETKPRENNEHSVIRESSKPWGPKVIQKAAVCCVGQKAASFVALAGSSLPKKVAAWNTTQGKEFRIYNLGGIPMVIRLLDGRRDEEKGYRARGVDAVFGVKGTKAHDIVPGAYLALRFGATVLNHDKSPVTFAQLEDMLLNPTEERIQYVIAGNRELAERMCETLEGHERRRTC